jgi:hypothetical protein
MLPIIGEGEPGMQQRPENGSWFDRVKLLFGVVGRQRQTIARCHPCLEGLETRDLLSFQLPGPFPAGIPPNVVVVADVNNDGKADLIIANASSNDVTVFQGNGDGTFGPARSFATGSAPVSVAVADVNGDGKLDIITVNLQENTVGVLLGNGDGSFRPPLAFAVGYGPRAVVVADLNGDSKPDIISANQLGNNVSVLLGNGDGSFQVSRTFPAASNVLGGDSDAFPVGAGSTAMTAADVDGDGLLDLITADLNGNSVTVLLGSGGSFVPVSLFGPAQSPDVPSADDSSPASQVPAQSPAPLAIAAVSSPVPFPRATSAGTVSRLSPVAPLPPTVTAVFACTAVVRSEQGQGQTPSEPSFSALEGTFDLQGGLLFAPPERLDLPTERDILSSMDVARSLLTGGRPQANLVPQQRDTVVAIGALFPDDPGAARGRRHEIARDRADKTDLRPYLISPVENPVLGPAPETAVLPLGLSGSKTEVAEVACHRWEKADMSQWGNHGQDPPPIPWWEEPVVLALGVAFTLASTASVAEPCRPWRRRR